MKVISARRGTERTKFPEISLYAQLLEGNTLKKKCGHGGFIELLCAIICEPVDRGERATLLKVSFPSIHLVAMEIPLFLCLLEGEHDTLIICKEEGIVEHFCGQKGEEVSSGDNFHRLFKLVNIGLIFLWETGHRH